MSPAAATPASHAPPGYDCPFCQIVAGRAVPGGTTPAEVVFRTPHVTAFIALTWLPFNPGHVLVVPNAHIENLYAMTPVLGMHVHEGARQVALALKAVYGCAGVSTRQHNEPAGYQHVWHYHMHVFPRWPHDLLYTLTGLWRRPGVHQRAAYAMRLRPYFDALGDWWPHG